MLSSANLKVLGADIPLKGARGKTAHDYAVLADREKIISIHRKLEVLGEVSATRSQQHRACQFINLLEGILVSPKRQRGRCCY